MDKISYNPGEIAAVYINANGNYTDKKLYLYTVNNVVVDSLNVAIFPQTNSVANTSPWEDGYDYSVSFSYTIPSHLRSGMYSWENKVFFIVKSATKNADITIVYPSNNDAAYNESGGKCLYDYSSTNSIRAHAVSFLRPLSPNLIYTQKSLSLAFMEWFTSLDDYSVQMICDQDMDDYSEIQNSKIVVLIGHSEYWSREARLNFDQFVNGGKDAIVLSGNTMWWQVRYSADKKKMICYKDEFLDTISNPLLKTIAWPYPSLNFPVLNSIGADWPRGGYGAIESFHGWHGYKIVQPNSPLLAGTGLGQNDILHCASREFDGSLLCGVNSAGDPILDSVNLGFCKIELIGYDWGVNVTFSPPVKGYGTFIVFKKSPASGIIINTASANWCSRFQSGIYGGFGSKSVGKVEQITLNMFNLLLEGDNVFATPVDSSCLQPSVPVPHNEGEFEVYPNPSRGILNIRYAPQESTWAHLEDIKIEVYNCFGIIVMQQELGVQLTTELDFRSQPSGTYFVQITSNIGSRIQKVVISNEK